MRNIRTTPALLAVGLAAVTATAAAGIASATAAAPPSAGHNVVQGAMLAPYQLSGGPLATSGGTPTPPPAAAAPTTAPRSSTSVAPSPNLPRTSPSGQAGSAPVTRTLTPQVIAKLLAAKATADNGSATDYTGLAAGNSFYAYDPATATYWAAGAVIAADTSLAGQVATQDGGGYDLFRRSAGGRWTAYDVGQAGIAGSTCAIAPRAAVAALWGWAPGACRPTVL